MNRFLQMSAALLGVAMPLVFDAALKGMLLLLLAALCVLALRRASASTRHLVWLIAVVALLVVPMLSVCLPQWRVLPRWAATEAVIGSKGPEPKMAPAVAVPVTAEKLARNAEEIPVSPNREASASPEPGSKTASSFPESARPAAVPAPVEKAEPGAWRAWLPALWVAGFALCALRLLLAYLLLRRTEVGCEEVTTGPLQQMLAGACAQLGVRQRVRLLVDSRRAIPVVWGVFRPRLVLPSEAEQWNERQLRSVLLHELAHIRRRDTASQWLIQIACALHWFNPLVWLAAWRLHAERERACDDLVLASGVRASDYAEHLLHVATKLEGAGWANACGLAMARPSRLEGRLLAVLSDRANRRRVTWALAVAALVLGACVAIPLAMLRAEEEAWNPPQAAHIGSNTRSVYGVHDSTQSAFVLFYAGGFSSSTESHNNPKTHTWTDAGRVTIDDGGKVYTFRRDHTAPESLSINGNVFDLKQGRVFVLDKNGFARQLALNAPAVTDQAGLAKMAEYVAGRLAAMPGQFQEVSADQLTTEQRAEREKAMEEGLKSARAGRDKTRQRLEAARAAGASTFEVETLAGDLKLWEVSVKTFEEILARMGKKVAEAAKTDWKSMSREALQARRDSLENDLRYAKAKQDAERKRVEILEAVGKMAEAEQLKGEIKDWEERSKTTREQLAEVEVALVSKVVLTYTQTPPADAATIKAGEGLDIFVKGDPTFSGHYQVSQGGKITLAVVGSLEVAGRTYEQAERSISEALHGVFPTRYFAVWIARKEAQAAPVPGGAAAPAAPADTPDAAILPGNNLEIIVNEDASYNGRYQVRRGGYIILPQIGRVAVAGKTVAGAEQAVQKALQATQLRKATVTIQRTDAAKDDQGPLIYLSGEFKNPRPLRLPEGTDTNLFSALLGAGGFTDKADLKHVKVLRTAGGQVILQTVDLSVLGAGADVKLFDGDVVVIPSGNWSVVYVTGRVKKPGSYQIGVGEKLSVLGVLLANGGFDTYVDKKRIHILRAMPDGTKAKIPVNISDIEKGKHPDMVLQANDIIVVPERWWAWDNDPEPIPENEKARALWKKWEPRLRGGKVPGGLIGGLASHVDSFLKSNGKAEDKMKLAEIRPRMDGTKDWARADAVVLLDAIATACATPVSWADTDFAFSVADEVSTGLPLPVELEGAAWGPPAANGLRVAWMLEPMREHYPLGSVLKARVLFHNQGQAPVVFSTDQWHQYDEDTARDAEGKPVNVVKTDYSGVTLTKFFRLAPGEYCEVPGHGIAIGAGEYEEESSLGHVGAVVEAKVGDQVRMQWTVDMKGEGWRRPNDPEKPEDRRRAIYLRRVLQEGPMPAAAREREEVLRHVMRDLLGTSPSAAEVEKFVKDETPDALKRLADRLLEQSPGVPFKGTLATGELKFRVVNADAEAAKQPRSATRPGRYVLSEKVRLQVTRITQDGKDTNKASLEFIETDPKASPRFAPYEIKLPDGLETFAIAWVRDSGEVWVGEKGVLRKYEYHNPKSVQEVRYVPWGVAAPPGIRELLENGLKLPGEEVPRSDWADEMYKKWQDGVKRRKAPQPATPTAPAPAAKPGSDARPPAEGSLAGGGAVPQLPAGSLSLDAPAPKSTGELNLNVPGENLTKVGKGTFTGPLVFVVDSVGRSELRPGVWLDIPVPEPGQPTKAILHWAKTKDHPPLRHEIQILSGSDWKTNKWAFSFRPGGMTLWLATEEQGATPMLREIAFQNPEEIHESWQSRKEHEPIRGLDIPGEVAEALERRFKIQPPAAGEEKKANKPAVEGQRIQAAKPEEEWIGGRKAPDLDGAQALVVTAVNPVFVVNAPGRWDLGNDASLEIPAPEAKGPLKAILRWPARGQWPALRHEMTVLSEASTDQAKWAVGWVPGKAALWVVAEEPGSASMLQQIVYERPEQIFENLFGRRGHEPIAGLDIPPALAREMERNFTIQQPDPKEEKPGGPYMGGQRIHVAKTEQEWIVEGFVIGANDKPFADVEVEAHCEHYPLVVLDHDRTDRFGHYRVTLRLGLETLAAFRGVEIRPKLSGFVDAEIGKSGEFNAVLQPGEKLEHPFAQRELVLGEMGRADFVLRQGCTIEGQIVDADGHPLARQFIAAQAPGQRRGYSLANATADEEGRFRLENIPAGRAVILRTNPYEKPSDVTSATEMRFEAGSTHRLRLIFKKGGTTRPEVTVEILGTSKPTPPPPPGPPAPPVPKGAQAWPPGIPKFAYGIDLEATPYTCRQAGLPRPDAKTLSKMNPVPGIFEMPLYETEKAWLRYLPAIKAFYLEMRDEGGDVVIFGPIPGDPFIKLGLRDSMKERIGKWETSVDLEHRVAQLLKFPQTIRLAAELFEAIHPPISLHEFDGYLAEMKKARAKAPDAETRAAVDKATARLTELMAQREAKRVKYADDEYFKVGEPAAENKRVLAAAWGEEKDGLRLGFWVAPGTPWQLGGEVEVEVWICNAGDQPVKFQSARRVDVGLRAWLKDKEGKASEAKIVMNTIPIIGDRLWLEPGKVYLAKKFTVQVRAPRAQGQPPEVKWNPQFAVAAGHYKFGCELSLPGFEMTGVNGEVAAPGAGEWMGQLTCADVAVQVMAAK